jgi:hypothetical protein
VLEVQAWVSPDWGRSVLTAACRMSSIVGCCIMHICCIMRIGHICVVCFVLCRSCQAPDDGWWHEPQHGRHGQHGHGWIWRHGELTRAGSCGEGGGGLAATTACGHYENWMTRAWLDLEAW